MDILPLNIEGINLNRPFVFAGPCSAESEEQVMSTARRLAAIGIQVYRAGVWKPRTKPGGFEGMGTEGLRWLRMVKEETGMLTATEVANAKHTEEALKWGVDILWLGARTTANPFAVQEIAECLAGVDIPVLVKNPVNPDLDLWIGSMERLLSCGIKRVAAVHRGFGAYEKGLFRNQPQWHIPIELKRRLPGLTIMCDPSHIGGRPELIYPLSQQAMDLGFDGLMIESHGNPSLALSDKEQQITPETLGRIISLLVIRSNPDTSEFLIEMRREIDEIDDRIMNLLSKRMSVAREIGKYKMANNISVLQPVRYDWMVNKRLSQALGLELDEEFIKLMLESIHEESVKQQFEIFKKGELGESS